MTGRVVGCAVPERKFKARPFNAGTDNSGGEFKTPPELNGDFFSS
jgi:hypothetical protein